MTSLPPTIDPEFAALLVPLTEAEKSLLRDSLRREKCCRDPLTVWAGENILLDGHVRLELCGELGIDVVTRQIELPDRRAAREWVWQNQAGRRNLRPAAAAYTRGLLYRSVEKKPGARTDLASGQDARKWASDDVAKLFGVDESTVRRDARYARDLDAVAAVLGEEFKRSILTGGSRLSRQGVRTLAAMSGSEMERFLRQQERWPKVRRNPVPPAEPDEPTTRDGSPVDHPCGGDSPAVPVTAGSGDTDACVCVTGGGSCSTPAEEGRDGPERDYLARSGEADGVDSATDEGPAAEPVDEEQLAALAEMFHRAEHPTRLAFLGLPLVRAAFDRLLARTA